MLAGWTGNRSSTWRSILHWAAPRSPLPTRRFSPFRISAFSISAFQPPPPFSISAFQLSAFLRSATLRLASQPTHSTCPLLSALSRGCSPLRSGWLPSLHIRLAPYSQRYRAGVQHFRSLLHAPCSMLLPFQHFSFSASQRFSISAFQHFSISAPRSMLHAPRFSPFSISAFQLFSISAPRSPLPAPRSPLPSPPRFQN
jgi:hypothetical protein